MRPGKIDTIQDAVLEFTGYDINKPSINKTVFTSSYLNRLEPLAFRLRNESKSMYNNSSSLNNDLIKNAADMQDKADGLISNKKYYAATSLYFESMINILTAQWGNEYNQNPNKEQLGNQSLPGNQSKPTPAVSIQKAPAFEAIISLIIVLIIRKMRR